MKFVIKGTDDNARAALKDNLEKQNAAFENSFNSLFKTASTADKLVVKPVAKPEKPAMTSTGGQGKPLQTDRNRRFF
jgi:hypothetical protein